jgi:hypothetical protein
VVSYDFVIVRVLTLFWISRLSKIINDEYMNGFWTLFIRQQYFSSNGMRFWSVFSVNQRMMAFREEIG